MATMHTIIRRYIITAALLLLVGYLLLGRSGVERDGLPAQMASARTYEETEKVLLPHCAFQSQTLHFIDQELLHLLGGSTLYPAHKAAACPDSPKPGSRTTCLRQILDSCRSEAIEANARTNTCPCEVPAQIARGGKHHKRYVEIGADNGMYLSNTFFLDKALGWEGICVEPSPTTFAQLQANRPNATNVNAVVSQGGPDSFEFFSFGDEAWTRQMSGIKGINPQTKDWATAQKYAKEQGTTVAKHTIPAVSFAELFKKHQFDSIEFMSVDVEGAELIVLSTIDFDAVDIHYIVVEANPPVQPWIDLLTSKGFRVMQRELMWKNDFDIWFVNTKHRADGKPKI
jgi:FkbM family methyltransferase